MIRNFNEKETQELLETLQWFNGVDFTSSSNKKTISVNIDLAKKIFRGIVAVNEISETEYDELIFAIKSVQEFCICTANEDDPMLNKFLCALENERKS